MHYQKKYIRDGVINSLTYGVLCLFLVCQPAIAQVRPSAEELIKGNLAAVFAVLQSQDLDQAAKSQKIINIVNPMFDFPLMAKLSLGKQYWPDLTPEQQERFSRLFNQRLRTSYLDRITFYTDEKVEFESPVVVKNKIHVPTYLISKEKRISIIYKLYESGSGWKVYDLEIQGVSIIRSYRSQFHEILKSGTIDDLMTKLEA